MDELTYPFDSKILLRKLKSIKRTLLESSDSFLDKKIAVLGGVTTNQIVQMLDVFLLNHGIRAEFYESDYNAFYTDALFPSDELLNFDPDLIYICTSYRNITSLSKIGDTQLQVEEKFVLETERFMSIWSSLYSKFNCPIVQNNFEFPLVRLLGNMDAVDERGVINFITRLNLAFAQEANSSNHLFICDVNYLSAFFGLEKWSDPSLWYLYKIAVNPSAIPLLAHNVANIIKSIYGKNKKAFALDLDNTLWGGIIGDDGVENIEVGPETAKSQAYADFQEYLKQHESLGIPLCIVSKNEENIAREGFERSGSVLKSDDFVSFKANWNPKDANILETAADLNIGSDSFVFVDDNPAEREIVKMGIKGIAVPVIDKPEYSPTTLSMSGFFESTSLTSEDSERVQMYKSNIARSNLESMHQDYDEYLESLEMTANISPFDKDHLKRIVQLANKTNQFNLTTMRYTEDEVLTLMNDDHVITIYGRLMDKFGDNGIVSLIIARVIEGVCKIETWLMSCRVFKRGLEYAMFDALVQYCKEMGVERIEGLYIPTKKNALVANFYEELGFSQITIDDNDRSEWVFKLPEKYDIRNEHIRIVEEQHD